MAGFAGITPGDQWRALGELSQMRADKARQQGLGYQATFYENEAKRSQDYGARMVGQEHGGASTWGVAPQIFNDAHDFQGFMDREPEIAQRWSPDFVRGVQRASGGQGRNSYSVLSTGSGGGIDRGEGDGGAVDADGLNISPGGAKKPAMKFGSPFHEYNNGDYRTQGDYNNISGDHRLANNPADYKRPFGGWDQSQMIASTPRSAPDSPEIGPKIPQRDGGWEADDNTVGYRGDGQRKEAQRLGDNVYDPLTGKGSPYKGGMDDSQAAPTYSDPPEYDSNGQYHDPLEGYRPISYSPPTDPVYQPHALGADGKLHPVPGSQPIPMTAPAAPRRGFIEPAPPRELPWTPAHGMLSDGTNDGNVSDQLEVRSGSSPTKAPAAAFAGVPESIFDRLKGLGKVVGGSFNTPGATEPRFKGPYKTPKQHAQGVVKVLKKIGKK